MKLCFFPGFAVDNTIDQPPVEELKIAVNIVEHTLDNLYELSPMAESPHFKQNCSVERCTEELKKGAILREAALNWFAQPGNSNFKFLAAKYPIGIVAWSFFSEN